MKSIDRLIIIFIALIFIGCFLIDRFYLNRYIVTQGQSCAYRTDRITGETYFLQRDRGGKVIFPQPPDNLIYVSSLEHSCLKSKLSLFPHKYPFNRDTLSLILDKIEEAYVDFNFASKIIDATRLKYGIEPKNPSATINDYDEEGFNVIFSCYHKVTSPEFDYGDIPAAKPAAKLDERYDLSRIPDKSHDRLNFIIDLSFLPDQPLIVLKNYMTKKGIPIPEE